MEVVAKRNGAVQRCYERELVQNPTLAGTVTAFITVNAAGKGVDVAAGGIGVRRLEDCITSALAGLQFPAPGDVYEIRYPFTLRPADP